MAYESLDDVIEEIANALSIYGGCDDNGLDGCTKCDDKCCRSYFVSRLKERILDAVRNDNAINSYRDPL